MKQKFRRFMAGFLAVLTMFTTLFSNGTTAFAASPSANIAFWNASVKNTGEVSELKAGYNHGKILYSMIDGNAAYCMNFGLAADGGQLMNSYDNPSTSLSAAQEKQLAYCLYFGYGCNSATVPSNDQCDQYIATQAMVWAIVANLFGTGSDDSAANKLCASAPNPTNSYAYYTTLKNNISASYYATRPSFATTMLANSEFVALLKQANTDSSKMAEVIGVSEAQLRFVTNTASGMGLIKCGSVVIPFDNQISKDTDLYKLYNTNIHEKIAEQKKREAIQNDVE